MGLEKPAIPVPFPVTKVPIKTMSLPFRISAHLTPTFTSLSICVRHNEINCCAALPAAIAQSSWPIAAPTDSYLPSLCWATGGHNTIASFRQHPSTHTEPFVQQQALCMCPEVLNCWARVEALILRGKFAVCFGRISRNVLKKSDQVHKRSR